jgi:hypothetical protein
VYGEWRKKIKKEHWNNKELRSSKREILRKWVNHSDKNYMK